MKKFNIVCTPGAAQYVPLFAHSLRKWSDCSFRLVANGCPLAEIRLLQQFCEKNPRFEFFALPVKTIIPHGQALSYLQSQERSDTFCFMDSDILATGEFLDKLTPRLGQYAGVFSGSPVWLEDEEKVIPAAFQEMAGRYSRTDENICLGSSYFAIYDNRALTQTIQATGICLNRYEWTDIPTKYQDQLVQMGLRKGGYDTAKLLNLLLLGQGERLLFQESPTLQHVGGISTVAADYSSLAFQVRVFLSQLSVFKRVPMPRPWRKSMRVSTAELLAMRQVRKKKIKTCRYVGKLLRALFGERLLPATPSFADPQTSERIERLTTHITTLYEEFREQL
ncbi:MAG: hypothetical protein GY832_43020 [Chloroflexi bacterium]|nr:hypothetical protein [Chloroflexota bacterium]